MRRRRGITLIEVLVAIFIMSIGLLALLTLFPLGALKMSQALQNDRAAASASAGANLCDAFDIRKDPQYDPPNQLSWFAVPDPSAALPPASMTGPGYPLYVDPYGVANNSGPLAGVIRRVAPSVMPAAIAEPNGGFATPAARYFTLPDDVTFLTNAQPDTGTPSGSQPVQRAGRYTWAYLLRRLQPYSRQSPVDLTVVVYAGRATLAPGGETTYAAAGNQNDTLVMLTWGVGVAPPNLHRGGWILDTSFNATNNSVNGDFYRIVAVTQTGANSMNLELQNPVARAGLTQMTVMDNVADVFSRGTENSTKWEFRTEQ